MVGINGGKMKKLILLLLTTLLLVSCQTAKKPASIYLEDYDYSIDLLRRTYPYFNVLNRQGIDMETHIADYRIKAENCQSTEEFYHLLQDFYEKLELNGHINLVKKEHFNSYNELYSEEGPWRQVMDSALAKGFYSKVKSSKQNTSSSSHDNIMSHYYHNLDTAFINIHSFSGNYIKEDATKLEDFFEDMKDSKYMVIDIRNNTGGDTRYFTDHIVPYLIDDDLDYKTAVLYKDDVFSKPFIKAKYDNFDLINTLITDQALEDYPYFKKDDLNQLSHILESTTTIQPKGQGFKGKVILLVSHLNYSAAEQFADLCQSTGIATLVGSQTGGDGIGFDPIMFDTPNTGIVLRYSMHYGINSKGQNSEEYGTTPDIDYKGNSFEYIMKQIRDGKI